MSEHESPWAPPVEKAPLSFDEAHAHELTTDTDIDKMAFKMGGERPAEAQAEVAETNQPGEISMTQEQFEQFQMIDPNSVEVSDFMTAHGIQFGGDILLNVEGIGPIAVTTEQGDFFTKVRSNAETLTPSEVLREEVSQELGEDALDALEIEDPSDVAEVAAVETSVVEAPVVVETVQTAETDEAKAAESARNLMGIQNEAPVEPTPEAAPEVATDIDINTELRKVEESAQEVDAVIRKLDYLSDDAEQLDKIVHGIDASIYNSAMIRTILMHTGENLAMTHARMRNVVANGVSEITEPLNRVGEALGDSEPLLDPADLRNTLEELENKTGSLGSVVSAIDMLIQDTHSGEVNVDDVQRLAKQLHAISQDNTKLLFSPKLEEKIAASRQ